MAFGPFSDPTDFAEASFLSSLTCIASFSNVSCFSRSLFYPAIANSSDLPVQLSGLWSLHAWLDLLSLITVLSASVAHLLLDCSSLLDSALINPSWLSIASVKTLEKVLFSRIPFIMREITEGNKILLFVCIHTVQLGFVSVTQKTTMYMIYMKNMILVLVTQGQLIQMRERYF